MPTCNFTDTNILLVFIRLRLTKKESRQEKQPEISHTEQVLMFLKFGTEEELNCETICFGWVIRQEGPSRQVCLCLHM